MDVAAVAAGRDQRGARESFEGSAVRDEAAAAALGLTSRQGSATGAAAAPGGGAGRRPVSQTFRSIGGAVKSQLRSLAAGGGRGAQPLVAAVAGISDGGTPGGAAAAAVLLLRCCCCCCAAAA